MPRQHVPVASARHIAKKYDLDQVIIIGRHTGDDGWETVTTYGKNKDHCGVAKRIGDFLWKKIMGHEDRTADK